MRVRDGAAYVLVAFAASAVGAAVAVAHEKVWTDAGSGTDNHWDAAAYHGSGDWHPDYMYANGGWDRMASRKSVDYLHGGWGHDLANGGAQGDEIRGEEGDDRIYNNGWNGLFGQDGPDKIVGGPGGDVLIGGDGRDDLRGSSGNDYIKAHDGKPDVVRGQGGFDECDIDQYDDWDRTCEERF